MAAPGLSCSMWGLVPQPRIEPRPSALRVWSLSHWTTREVPRFYLFKVNIYSIGVGQVQCCPNNTVITVLIIMTLRVCKMLSNHRAIGFHCPKILNGIESILIFLADFQYWELKQNMQIPSLKKKSQEKHLHSRFSDTEASLEGSSGWIMSILLVRIKGALEAPLPGPSSPVKLLFFRLASLWLRPCRVPHRGFPDTQARSMRAEHCLGTWSSG